MWGTSSGNLYFNYPLVFTRFISAISSVSTGVPNTTDVSLNGLLSTSYSPSGDFIRHNVIVIGY